MDTFENYAGQSVHISRLREEFSTGRFTHAYLFAGPAGTGKKSVARLCAQTALCRGEQKPCGVCGPCRRILAGTHPDFHVIEPLPDKRDITVGQMRDALKETDVHSFEDSIKFFFIPEAERMNAASQNTLLKTLEEPADGTVFLLTAVHASALLPTVVSRCRMIRFHPLSDEEAQARLRALGVPESQVAVRARLGEGCVGAALNIKDETIALRNEVSRDFFSFRSLDALPGTVGRYKDDKGGRGQILDLLEETAREIICALAGDGTVESLPPGAREFAEKVPLAGGLAVRASIIEARKMLQSNVSYQSALETVLLKISEEYNR